MITIVGGGFTGLAAAFEFLQRGQKVLVLEASSELGGLAGTFEIQPGVSLEKFYHHWFGSDHAVLDLIKELGAEDRIESFPTNTGLYAANSIFRLASPFDLLRFSPLPIISRFRTGIMALRARSVSDWRKLEKLSAEEWIISLAGKKSYEVIWKPLLQGKFGAEAPNVSAVWFWNKMKLRGSSRNSKGHEELKYFRGGFGALTKLLGDTIRKLGGEIRLNANVTNISSENGQPAVTINDSERILSSKVLVTTPLPVFSKICPSLPEDYKRQLSQIRFLGNVCLILRLNRSLSSTYWLNIGDPSFPFVGVIEHTNFDDPKNYNGEHIVYLSKYLPTSDRLYTLSDSEFFSFALPFIQRMFPQFNESWVIGYKCWRAEYSQPVVTRNYSAIIPAHETPLPGVWLSTMAQIYPEDRGTNYAVRAGREVARLMAR